MKSTNIIDFIDNITFKYKTYILIFIITGGMLSIIILSQISTYAIKNDYERLFEKRTKPLILLESLKDVYEINVLDTIYDIKNNNISFENGKEVLELAKNLSNNYWNQYKQNRNSEFENNFFLQIIKKLFIEKNYEYKNEVLLESLMTNIDKKMEHINNYINYFDLNSYNEVKYETNSIKIYITSLINYDLKVTIDEKRDTNRLFNYIFLFSILSIVFVFIFSILLSIIIINNFKKLHKLLELKVERKTKELMELNDNLEKRIEIEVKNSRKKDLIMFQQAKLASMGEMLNNIAHQWRQPLGSISMIIQSFQTKMEFGKLTPEFVDTKVKDALLLADNMSTTLDDFKNFFTPDNIKSKFSLKNCIEHSFELSKYVLEKYNIHHTIEMKKDIVIDGFYNGLSHVLLNLINNSKDALMDKDCCLVKEIRIVVIQARKKVILHFMDNGGGISDKILPKIFEPYFTTKYKSAGTGIGLYMSKQIIEKHMNGSIKCKNIKNPRPNCDNCKSTLFILEIPFQ
ncbi:sensor histidine kinase [Halarcobacter ebronensis]|uniref:histidine kinase n=1 Tax=Halarcobacter ebronensis TaxID=1462615 RepID=A0A4Q1AQ70_9BACT|nr:HAMP domain-containing sensor histidine kinase [Halarcobacter ebronensis]RXK04527.1 histidine kinase [Halarcobacter ebronensis]